MRENTFGWRETDKPTFTGLIIAPPPPPPVVEEYNVYSCDGFVMQEVGSRNRFDTFLFPLRFVFTFIFIFQISICAALSVGFFLYFSLSASRVPFAFYAQHIYIYILQRITPVRPRDFPNIRTFLRRDYIPIWFEWAIIIIIISVHVSRFKYHQLIPWRIRYHNIRRLQVNL